MGTVIAVSFLNLMFFDKCLQKIIGLLISTLKSFVLAIQMDY